ncbi:MAG TPA: hypothetical protein VGD23_04545, partial [Sphingomicrobium sp.]
MRAGIALSWTVPRGTWQSCMFAEGEGPMGTMMAGAVERMVRPEVGSPSRSDDLVRVAGLGALLLMVAACSPQADSSHNNGSGATEASQRTAATSAPARTGFADVDGGRIASQVYGDRGSGKTPLRVRHG